MKNTLQRYVGNLNLENNLTKKMCLLTKIYN